jgi:nucleoside-diphosphate-sugar epimerase
MRALVTGVAGFVGSHLAEALVARGDTVRGIDCFSPYYERAVKESNLASLRISPRFEIVEADLRAVDLAEMLDGIDVVFHQSAQPGVRHSWSTGFDDYVGHNIVATQQLLETILTARPSVRVVYASSSSVYGKQERYPTRETDVPAPFSPYGVTKLAAEHLCRLYAANWNLHTTSLRYFTVYGPRQRPDMSIHRLCEAALAAEAFPRYGDGTQIREFTYVDDIVRANILAADNDIPPGRVMNVSGGGEISLNDLVALIEALSGEPVKIETRAAQAGDAPRNGGAIDVAQVLLGWEPRVALRDGVAAQLAWHRSREQLAS